MSDGAETSVSNADGEQFFTECVDALFFLLENSQLATNDQTTRALTILYLIIGRVLGVLEASGSEKIAGTFLQKVILDHRHLLIPPTLE